MKVKHIPFPLNYSALSSLLSLAAADRNHGLGAALHAAIIKHPHHFAPNPENLRHITVVHNALISLYSKCAQFRSAHQLFDEMPHRDPVSYNSLLTVCLSRRDPHKAGEMFRNMIAGGQRAFDHATLTTMLSVYNEMEIGSGVDCLHAVVVTSGYGRVLAVGNALVSAYFKSGRPRLARRVFDEMGERSVVTWTAMVSGLAQGMLCEESLGLFREMRFEVEANGLSYVSALGACCGLREVRGGRQIHGLVVKSGFLRDVCVESALMDVYTKCGVMEDALRVFEGCVDPDEISLTVVLVGLAQNGEEEGAFGLFARMVSMGFEIDANVVSAVLGAFGASASFSLGKQIHGLVVKKAMGGNVFVSNGLVNMYAKCGELGESGHVFERMKVKNSVSWNSMIAAFARHGRWAEALRLYDDMRADGAEPTDVTFLSLLHACSHGGLVEKGMELLKSMSSDYGIVPRMDHYACVVDMLGRAGQLREAKRFIEDLPVEPNAHVWQALLGACSIRGDLETGKYAAENLVASNPECPAAYVLLANMFSSEGKWTERAKVIKEMKEMGVKKDTGASWIEVDKEVHVFVVEDKVHPQCEVIYEVLDELFVLSRDQEDAFHRNFLFNNWAVY